MTREQMLQELQEKIADKTLRPGLGIQRYHGIVDTLCHFNDYGGHLDYGVVKGSDGQYFGEQTTMDNFSKIRILGHPISLARVLSKLGDEYGFWDGHILKKRKKESICLRRLINSDGSDAYLDDQSDETIKVLHGLLVR